MQQHHIYLIQQYRILLGLFHVIRFIQEWLGSEVT